jgi:large subunit ribosomal protein L32
MAVPKRRMSKRRIGQRNSHAAISPPATTKCANCGADRPSHRICPRCGQYAGRVMIDKGE